MSILVTGSAGFIGSNFILNWMNHYNEKIIALDKLTYAGNLENLKSIEKHDNYKFIKGDIGDSQLVESLLIENKPRAIINFAAESHVDRSISSPFNFIETNIMGTYKMLEQVLKYFDGLSKSAKNNFRFLHVSTDEVFGSLDKSEQPFKESNKYKPNSPYSASKASSDHLVRAWNHTYGLPVITTNCSNNYGPYHFPEKLIPLCILKALDGQSLPIYGDGQQIRDWLYVVDHCKGIDTVLNKGNIGETYNIGGNNEKTNLDVVNILCDLLDELRPRADGDSYKKQIIFVDDRPGHDKRYAINSSKITKELGWKPEETFHTGMRKTINWYLNNQEWISHIKTGQYRNWLIKKKS